MHKHAPVLTAEQSGRLAGECTRLARELGELAGYAGDLAVACRSSYSVCETLQDLVGNLERARLRLEYAYRDVQGLWGATREAEIGNQGGRSHE